MKIVKSSCGGKKRVRTCTFSPQVNIKNKREPIQTQEDINAAHSEAKIQELLEDLKNVIWTKVSNVATSYSFGYDENEVNDYFFVDVTPTQIGEDDHEAIRVEVRAEVSYEGLEELMEALNPIIESYDSYAYFEPVQPGIIEAYVSLDQVDMSIYGESEYSNSSNLEYSNRTVLRYKGKSFTVYDNSDSINLPADADIEALRKWKAQITQEAGAYNDADEQYEWASLSNGVVSYYRRGKLVDTSYYMSPSDWGVETLGEWSELVINDVIENLYEANRDVPDHMVYNSTDLEDVSAGDNPMSFRYKGRRIKLLTDGTGYAIYEKGEMIDYGFKSLEDAEAAIDEYDDIYQDDVQVYSATEEDEEDLPMVDQEYDSAATSINSNKLPAIYKMVNFNEGDVIVDFGGGKFDNAVEYIRDKGATLCVYDPYNRSAEHNREVLKILRENGGADAAVNSNVLNVIKEPEARKNVLENIARITKPGAPIYITVYEGKGDGQEGPTKSGYQLNRKTADYLEEIQEVFPDATRRGKLITAHNSGSVSSATDIQAGNNTSYEKYLLNQVGSLLIDKLESEYDIEFFITDMYIDGDDLHIQVYGDDSLHGDIDIPVDYSGDVYDFADDAFNKLKDIFQNNSSNTVEGSQDISRYDKEIVSYRKIISKSVEDNDDFLTDYTMYEVVTEDGSVEYECYFGDNDLYGPWNGEGLDFEADNYDEAVEWYNSYSSDEIQSSTVLDSNTEFRENFEEAVDIFYEEYPATVELTDEQDEEYDTLYRAYVRETGVLYSVKPGVVYIDINWDSSDILQALEETAEAIGIEHYPDPLDVDASKSIQGDAFSSLENQYLSPPEYDDPIEHEDSQELIEVELDQMITVDVDGNYEWDDDTYVWASPDRSNEEWRSEDGVYIDDKVGVVEHIDDLIIPNVPTRPGKYRVTGLAQLIYDVSGIQEYRTNYGPDDYESDLDTDHAVVAFNFSQSTVENLKITPVRR